MNERNHCMDSRLSVECLSKLSVGKQGTYVLNSCTNKGNETKFAVALSNFTVRFYDTNGIQLAEHVHKKNVTGLKFSSTDPFLLFSSSLDGKINVWDARCKGAAQTFIEDSDGTLKPLSCFDYNSDEQLLCAGTEIIREDSFNVFWDRRSSACLGAYWNGHTDDITQVQFHPSVNSCMASASVDGLINVYDLNESTEDDALIHTLNVGSGVSKVSWRHSDFISCSTSIEEYQLWSVTEASPLLSLSREDLTNNSQYKVDYIIDSLQIANSWYLVTGNYKGEAHLWCSDNKNLKPADCLLKAHSDVVRTICYNSQDDVLFTGGEDGSICNWKVSRV